jgi:hypothetical protein
MWASFFLIRGKMRLDRDCSLFIYLDFKIGLLAAIKEEIINKCQRY